MFPERSVIMSLISDLLGCHYRRGWFRDEIARRKSPPSLGGKSLAHRDESFERFKCRTVIQIHSVTRQIRNRDHHQLVLLAEANEVWRTRHGAVVIYDL